MASNQFMVFGYDVRDYGRLWLAAWRDFLFGDESPVRAALDSMVTLEHPDGALQTFQAGNPIDHDPVQIRGLALPDDLVLTRTLRLPAIAEADIDAALNLEVSACSPFAADDTAAGWRLGRDTDGDGVLAHLAIVSRAAVMQYLGETRALHDPQAREIWASSGGVWVVMRGFGEATREGLYRRRVMRSGIMIAASLLLVLALAGTSTLLAGWRLSKLESIQRAVGTEARDAIRLRDELAQVNATIGELNALGQQLASPQQELSRLTALLPDSAHLTQYTQDGLDLRLRGRAQDAASLQQSLTKVEAFRSVTASQAITRVPNSDLEQFFLDVELEAVR